ncbi:phage holin family protein [Enterococcus sp. DIV0174]|uniref:phage holin family protein n=1 Tax=Enterococcus sp. DIV0174 TaxID=2774785 RepID=UPI003D2FFD99|nr:phage holin family protein [Vibrio parahaemolyticus]
MKNINWKIRFNWAENKTFIFRFVIAVFLPVLTYYGLKAEDLTSWKAIGDVIVNAISNPFVLGTMLVNALNVIPDPTTQGVTDSKQALEYDTPKIDEKADYGDGQEFTERKDVK